MTNCRIVTLLLVNCAALLERADESLLPAVYDEVGRAFKISPSQLGSLTFIRGLVQALASPLAAYLSLTHNRIHVVAIGAFAWGVATAALGLCTAFWQAAIVKVFNGIGLAVVVPAIQSIVADMHEEHERGLGFGFLHATGQLGVILGGIFATVLAGQGTVLGIDGWRFAFLNVALISVILGFALLSFANVNDNVKHQNNRIRDGQKLIMNDSGNNESRVEEDGLWELWKGTRRVLLVPTFQVIVAQGIVGQTPWYAMAFFTLWLELLGFKNSQAAFLAAMLSVGNMFGSIFGGWIGDLSARHLPNSGRIICSQFSAGVGIPLSAVLLLLIPQDVTYGWLYGTILFLMGFLMSWNSPATNWPIFAEIVPEKLHTTVYAVDLALEKSISALGTPLVGILAERLFGFSTASAFRPDAKNARALAEGVFCLVAVPFSLCLFVISVLYWTYPKDRDRARKESSDLD